MLPWLLTIFLVVTARQYLPRDRVPKWKTSDPNYGPDYGQPEQIHLSLGASPTEVVVTWLTFDDTEKSLVNYGLITDKKLEKVSEGLCSEFIDTPKSKMKRYIHRSHYFWSDAWENISYSWRIFLSPAAEYRVGSDHGWSAIYKFTALTPRDDGGYEIAVFGDLGNQNGRSLGKLQRMAQDGDIDMVLHVGDFAYNLDTDDGNVGDEFLRQIEPIAAYVPYMVAVGNHEAAYNFSHYVSRFTMPRSEHNLFYSFDLGRAHFIIFSTEFYFYTNYGWSQILNQWNWLIDDLTRANNNRANVPWILTFGHRPMYCSDFDGDDCTKYESIVSFQSSRKDMCVFGIPKGSENNIFFLFRRDVA
ncbi:Ser/Thr phosphatase family protein [Cooperia oncophora]